MFLNFFFIYLYNLEIAKKAGTILFFDFTNGNVKKRVFVEKEMFFSRRKVVFFLCLMLCHFGVELFVCKFSVLELLVCHFCGNKRTMNHF